MALLVQCSRLMVAAAVICSSQAFSFGVAVKQSTNPTSLTRLYSTATPPATSTGTPLPKYPVERGSTVDSRELVSALAAVRLGHILLASTELARDVLEQLRSTDLNFGELAAQLSNCDATREKEGEVGWVNLANNVESNEHLDEILPPGARQVVMDTSTKPGDILLVESHRGAHLVQIVDVLMDLDQLAVKRFRTNQYSTSSEGRNGPQYYKMETMGCQMNQADSERMEGQLQSLGMQPLAEDDKALPDVVVLNTCSIRDHAEQKVYSYLGPHAKRKRNGEAVTIIVAGCVAQQEGHSILRRIPEVDLVVGPQYANRLGELLEHVELGHQVVSTEASHVMQDVTKPRRSSSTCAWVNIIYGCNERCTYCIVPTTRGVEQSRPVEQIVAEIKDLVVNDNYKEVTLLGQNIDAYGRDMSPKRKFSSLLSSICDAVPELKRLRFVTSHPRYMSLGVVDAVAENQPVVCQNFHIPFQSGSNAILQSMGRGHTREQYMTIVNRIRERLPDASITADVIVGFPGETEQDFQDTLDLMKEVIFDSVNTAAYSPRPHTPAAIWDNQLSETVKKDRLTRINVLNLEHAKQRRERMMGRTVEILVEERNVKLPSQVMGRTTHGYLVYCPGEIDELRGQLVQVKITDCQTYSLTGHIVQDS